MQQERSALPFIRVWTFGPLDIQAREVGGAEESTLTFVPLSTTKLQGRGTTAAFSLLKVLLCQSQRHAPRDLLLELLWPDHPRRQASARLDDAASVLRTLLRPASGENLLEYRHGHRETGSGYALAPYPLIWVDAEAFAWYMVQASRLERFGEDALPLWEEAYALASRGAFLAEELYSQWAHARRDLLSGHLRQCVHALTRLYRERGIWAEGERVLREHLGRDPLDEDGLRPFLERLGEQERYQEALDAYQRTREALAQEGRTPDPRTHDIAEYLRTKQIRRSRTGHERPPTEHVLQKLPGEWRKGEHTSLPVSEARASSLGNSSLFSEMHRLFRAFSPGTAMDDQPALVSQRRLLEVGIAAFLTHLARLDSKRISAVEREEVGRALSEAIIDGWKHLFSVENAQIVSMGRLHLSLIHQAHPLLPPRIIPYLYAGAHSFLGIGLHFQERDEEALREYHEAYLAALATGNPWYIAQNFICQADSHHALKQYELALQAVEEALSMLAMVSEPDEALVRAKAHLLSCWADNAMMLQDDRATQEKLALAETYLDGTTAHEEFDRGAWLLITGKYALMRKQFDTAKACFLEALEAVPEPWVLRRAMTATGLAMACAQLGERDASLTVAQTLVPLISTTNAPMTNRWFTEYLRNDLLHIFPADSDVRGFIVEASKHLPQQPDLLRALE